MILFGGAFNPPTLAHINLAEYVNEYLQEDGVIYMPSKMTYIENDEGKNFAFPDEIRYAMLEKIAESRPWMQVSDYEIRMEQQPRTYATLCHLREEGKNCRLLFGSDKLEELETVWRNVDKIGSEFGIICMVRSEDDVDAMLNATDFLRSIRKYIQIVETPKEFRSVSSSKVRALFQEGKFEEIQKLVPQELDGLRGYSL